LLVANVFVEFPLNCRGFSGDLAASILFRQTQKSPPTQHPRGFMSAPSLKKFLIPAIRPFVPRSAFIAPGAVVLGAVELGEESSVWFGSVLRGDINRIVVGAQSNVQDGSVLHVSDDHACILGDRVTVGHRAIVHACTVGDEVLVGMGAIILDGAVIGARSTIAAGALVTKNMQVPEGSLVMGSPAKVVRALSTEEQAANKQLALKYVEVSRRYLAEDVAALITPSSTAA
jgi:carbonic anhydrase/acetyltransferase-like protein (isoleucine patch superfamily)